MRVACSSQSYDDVLGDGRLTLVDWLRTMADELSLDAVELEDKHVGEPRSDRLEALRSAAARYGLVLANIAFMNDFGVADDARRRDEEARTREWMLAAERLGSRFLRTFAGWPEGDRAARWPAMIASLRSVCGEAERRGVRLVMENHNHGGFVQTGADAAAILSDVGDRKSVV